MCDVLDKVENRGKAEGADSVSAESFVAALDSDGETYARWAIH